MIDGQSQRNRKAVGDAIPKPQVQRVYFVDDLGIIFNPFSFLMRASEMAERFEITIVARKLKLAFLQKASGVSSDGGAGAAHVANGDTALRQQVFCHECRGKQEQHGQSSKSGFHYVTQVYSAF